jgi:hypothetical protein
MPLLTVKVSSFDQRKNFTDNLNHLNNLKTNMLQTQLERSKSSISLFGALIKTFRNLLSDKAL